MKFGQYHNTSEDMDNTTPKNGKLWPQKQFWNIVKAKEYVLISKAHDITVKVLWGFKIHIGGMKHFCLNLKIKNTFLKKLGNKFDEHVPQFPRRCLTGLERVSFKGKKWGQAQRSRSSSVQQGDWGPEPYAEGFFLRGCLQHNVPWSPTPEHMRLHLFALTTVYSIW